MEDHHSRTHLARSYIPLGYEEDFWQQLLTCVTIGQIFLGIIFIITPNDSPLPWGRFRNRAALYWGNPVPAWLAWMVQELPSAVIPFAVLLQSHFFNGKLFNLVVLLAFLTHYAYRVFVYSLRHYLFTEARRHSTVPFLIPLSAFMFCFVNGLAQSLSGFYSDYSRELRGLRYLFPRWVCADDASLAIFHKTSLWDLVALLRFVAGFGLFLFGMTVNVLSDEHLLRLKTTRSHETTSQSASTSPRSNGAVVTLRRSSRIAAKKDGDDIVTFKCNVQSHGGVTTPYKIPREGWFQLVSCANYWGEICEWFGYALMCNSTASFAFAVFTLLFLGRRGFQTHKWYQGRFGANYPGSRRAVIPYIL